METIFNATKQKNQPPNQILSDAIFTNNSIPTFEGHK